MKEQIKKFIKLNKDMFIKDKINSIKISRLAMGENNINILVTINNKNKFVFRIGLRKDIEDNMKNEFENLKNIPKDFGPKPILFDDSKKIISKIFFVYHFMPGKHIKKWKKKHLEIHAKKLASLHKKRFKKKKFSLYKRLLEEINEYKKVLEDPFVLKLLPIVKEYIKKNDSIFLKLKYFSRIHRDLCVNNIIFNKNIFYLDWEWSIIGDNAVDLAKLYHTDCKLLDWSLKLNKREEDLFLEEYQKRLDFKDETLKERIHIWQIYIMFTDFLYFKWKLLNWEKEKSDKPKEYYEKTVDLMKECFSKKFF